MKTTGYPLKWVIRVFLLDACHKGLFRGHERVHITHMAIFYNDIELLK